MTTEITKEDYARQLSKEANLEIFYAGTAAVVVHTDRDPEDPSNDDFTCFLGRLEKYKDESCEWVWKWQLQTSDGVFSKSGYPCSHTAALALHNFYSDYCDQKCHEFRAERDAERAREIMAEMRSEVEVK